ncbi:MAG: methyltransferase [Pseudomonadota bacterium]
MNCPPRATDADTPAIAPRPDKALSSDRFLGGRLVIDQPLDGGHRSGIDAVLLGASLPEGISGTLFDLGSGVGVAGLVALAYEPGLSVTLVDIDPRALHLATLNAERNAGRIGRDMPQNPPQVPRLIEADVTLSGRARRDAGLNPQSADVVLTNPPFHDGARNRPSPDRQRARAHMADDTTLQAWFETALWMLRPKGRLTLIVSPQRLPLILQTIDPGLGGITILPVLPRRDQAATRILVTGRRDSRAPLRLLPGLVLHDTSGSAFLPEVKHILTGNGRLSLS